MITRLQLGASRLEGLDVRVLDRFLDETWMHLGDADRKRPAHNLAYYVRAFRRNPLTFTRAALTEILGRSQRPKRPDVEAADLYARTNFAEFVYLKGAKLPFGDNTID